jgi:uncharacterized damage-inducible protein DinB
MDLLDRMLAYDRWATLQLLDVCRNLSDAQLDQTVDVGHQTLRETFDHMIYTVGFWTGYMTGHPVDHDRTTQNYDRSIPALIERFEGDHAAYAAACRAALDEQRMDETFIDYYNYPQSYGATILQVPVHNVEHRTEALHILNRLGIPDLPEIDPQVWAHRTGRVQPAAS